MLVDDGGVDQRWTPLLGGSACAQREKRGFNNITYCNGEAHSEFTGAVISPGTHDETTHQSTFIWNFRGPRVPIVKIQVQGYEDCAQEPLLFYYCLKSNCNMHHSSQRHLLLLLLFSLRCVNR